MKKQTILKGKKKIYMKRFETISEFTSYCKTTPVNHIFTGDQSSLSKNKSFTMTESFEEAERLLSGGWSEGAEKLTTALKIANASIQNKEVKRLVYDIVGFQASVPRYIQGIPTNMVNKQTFKKKQRIITLHKSVAYNGVVSTNQILEDSVKFLQIVQAIESKGIRVNVYVNCPAESGNESSLIVVKIKAASEKLNISKMSFPLLHPSFLRRYMFRALEVDQDVQAYSWKSGYGRPMDSNEVEPFMEKDEIYIPTLITKQAAIDIVENMNV